MKKIFVLLVVTMLMLSSCTINRGGNTVPKDSGNGTEINGDNSQAGGGQGKARIGLNQGDEAPGFKLKDIDGREVSLSDYRGKTVVLNFFGVWCPYCKEEMPDFVKVYNEYKAKNVELIVVDYNDSKSALTNYLKLNNFDIKPLMDTRSEVVSLYQISGFPTTYILDGNGIIRFSAPGAMPEGMLADVLDTILK
jgi:peroxiredoxin